MLPAPLSSELVVVESGPPELLAPLVLVSLLPGAEVGPGWPEAKPVSAADPLQARAPARRAREAAPRACMPGV